MIEINSENCVLCGKCKKLCPMGILSIEDKKIVIAERPKCISCGHCQGVCQFNAITIDGMQEEVIKAEKNIAYDDLKNLIMSNRSIRNYQERLVDEEVIQDIIRTLDYTASAKNDQKIKWIVVSTKEKVEEIYQICLARLKKKESNQRLIDHLEQVRNAVTLGAPHLLIAYADKEKASMPLEDSVIKTTLATMLMHSQGISSCFLGFLEGFINTNKQLKKLLGLEDNERVYSAIGFGYNDNEIYVNVPTRKKADVRYLS